MVRSTADLRQLKGIGAILGKRLYDAGFDSFAKIALAGEDGLRRVRGISTRTITAILEQSRQLAGLAPAQVDDDQDLRRRVGAVRDKVESLARTTRLRFGGKMSHRCSRKLGSELVNIEEALVRIRDLGTGSELATKALQKAEKKVTGLEEASLKKVQKNFKKARKAVVKAFKHAHQTGDVDIVSQPPS